MTRPTRLVVLGSICLSLPGPVAGRHTVVLRHMNGDPVLGRSRTSYCLLTYLTASADSFARL